MGWLDCLVDFGICGSWWLFFKVSMLVFLLKFELLNMVLKFFFIFMFLFLSFGGVVVFVVEFVSFWVWLCLFFCWIFGIGGILGIFLMGDDVLVFLDLKEKVCLVLDRKLELFEVMFLWGGILWRFFLFGVLLLLWGGIIGVMFVDDGVVEVLLCFEEVLVEDVLVKLELLLLFGNKLVLEWDKVFWLYYVWLGWWGGVYVVVVVIWIDVCIDCF